MTTPKPRAKTIPRKVSIMQANLEEQKRATGSRTACPRLPRAHITSIAAARSTDLPFHQSTHPTIYSSTQPIIPLGRGRSQSEPSPVLFVRRRGLINSLVPRPPNRPSAFVRKWSSPFVAKYQETSRPAKESSRDISRFVKVCREINQKISAVAINREMNSPKRRKRGHEFLIGPTSALALPWVAAEVTRQTTLDIGPSSLDLIPQPPPIQESNNPAIHSDIRAAQIQVYPALSRFI